MISYNHIARALRGAGLNETLATAFILSHTDCLKPTAVSHEGMIRAYAYKAVSTPADRDEMTYTGPGQLALEGVFNFLGVGYKVMSDSTRPPSVQAYLEYDIHKFAWAVKQLTGLTINVPSLIRWEGDQELIDQVRGIMENAELSQIEVIENTVAAVCKYMERQNIKMLTWSAFSEGFSKLINNVRKDF